MGPTSKGRNGKKEVRGRGRGGRKGGEGKSGEGPSPSKYFGLELPLEFCFQTKCDPVTSFNIGISKIAPGTKMLWSCPP